MKWLKYAFFLLVSLPMVSQAAVDLKDPYRMIDQVSQKTFSRLKSEQNQIQRNPELLRRVVREELLPYVNTRYAAYKVLGPHLKQTSPSQRDSFVSAFSDYLVASYAQVLTQYTNQDIQVESAKSVPANRNIVSVRVDILDTKRPPIRLDFKLRKNNKTGEWQGYDMVAEGVSMISTKQSEWSGQLRSEGVEAVTKSLRDLAAKPIRREAEKQ
ncbi:MULTISPECIES: phospholipid-binding protein MlaC [Photobacterium]|uniref:Toluene tolerance protein n=1 Tax=Photobacterium ganghwense TaxID=320778 RepID=A0A0J1JVQ2_9GAMM|nr:MULTISPECIES: phospholipid-binding protein MlaC [Photobacterium]KLV06377.1 toluene tolerance protein [Photobacterium ganghwense]MBV1840212.1 phospholipid-binding protein MlaC [Photobacterium ganghwense]PSU06740.1 phospholipid-binding protein MlaC [Photobacterium ganghwense]QSV14414.1 phospholipid-binding protein MlaC [Photobacterium ganghwense]